MVPEITLSKVIMFKNDNHSSIINIKTLSKDLMFIED